MYTPPLVSTACLTMLLAIPAANAQSGNATLRDDTYVTISGTVKQITDADNFTLQHEGGIINVDTNDRWSGLFDRNAATRLQPGDEVTVTGVVDNNLFTAKEIEASSVYHQNETYSQVYQPDTPYDAEYFGYGPYNAWGNRTDISNMSLSGQVSNVISDSQFEMKYGDSTLTVDTSQLDGTKTRRLNEGDRVVVYGDMDNDWFGARELNADYLIRTDVYQPRSSS